MTPHLNLHKYIIDHSDINRSEVLRPWRWLLPAEFTVWMMNRYGDLFIILDDGSVQMLDGGGGTLERVADSCDDFADKIDQDANANQWLMIPLIDRAVQAGMNLKSGHCYGYRKPPVLGGDYTVENTCVIPIAAHYRFHTTIHEQIKDVPDGERAVIDFGDYDSQ